MDPPGLQEQEQEQAHKLMRDRRPFRMTSWPCDLAGTSSIKDKQPACSIVFRATRIRTPPNHKSTAVRTLIRLLNRKSVT